MKNFRLLFCTCLLSFSLAAMAQFPKHPHYVKPESDKETLLDSYKKWQPGKTLYSDPVAAEDEQFYISRVKLKTRFVNANTQVRPNQNSERKLLWWVPISTGAWNAIPAYFFDSEVFNMWSYIDHYGNWTGGMLRLPGSFTDVCRRNGVSTSGVDGVPFGATVTPNSGSGALMRAMIDEGAEKYLKFLRYYGIDGVGYNSEFNINSTFAGELQNFFAEGFKKKDLFGVPNLSMAWYSLTNNAGSISGASWDSLNDGNDNWFHKNGTVSNYFFSNYNWNSGEVSTSIRTAQKHQRSTYDVYMGMNMQGESSVPWNLINTNPVSFGMWGAHDMNMLFESRGERGSEPAVSQDTYLTRSERFFTGGSSNPVNTPAITDLLAYSVDGAKKFHGISKFIVAKSALSWELDVEPFVTYLNLGNGAYFNVEGNTTFHKEWYNIGIQDYLPTWRWWWTSSFMGREVADVPTTGLEANFTWEDAWFGGSCLKISGSVQQEYLQLFKTKFAMAASDKLTIRYKVLKGTGKMAFATSVEGDELKEIASKEVDLAVDVDGNWKTYEVKVGRTFALTNKTLAMLGLKFMDTQGLDVLIGEVSIKRGVYPTPNAPQITAFRTLGENYLGADVKIIFKMKDANPATPEIPVYNSDVNAWFYKIYVQQEGEEPTLCTATMSWAAYVVGAPLNTENRSRKVRMGVQAVSLDGDNESSISWSDFTELPEISVLEGIEIDKPIIKANEEFTIRYTDPNHAAAKSWLITSAIDQTEAMRIEGGSSATAKLPKEGVYDVFVTHANNELDTLRALIQISSNEVGAMPQIKSLKANNSADPIEVNKGAAVTYSYVGRPADGTVSRGLNLPEKGFGFKTNQLGLDGVSGMGGRTKFTLTYWLKLNKLLGGVEGTTFLNIRYPKDSWPSGDWGYYWQDIHDNGTIQSSLKGGTSLRLIGRKMVLKQWYHFAYVFDYTDKGRSVEYYINGCNVGKQTLEKPYDWKPDNYLLIGGKAANRSGLDGVIDEVQYYNKALTEAEVLNSMKHQDVLPEGLVGYWDFETEPDTDNNLVSTGTVNTLMAGVMQQSTQGEGNNLFEPQPIDFGPGTPFLAGANYSITTTPQWSTPKAKVSVESSGDTNGGDITVNYPTDGIYTATLTLQNGWGKDVKTFSYVKVEGGGSSIDENQTVELRAYPNPFVNEVFVQFTTAGSYQVEVYDAVGNMISRKNMNPSAGDFVSVSIDGTSGMYFIKVSEGSKVIKTLKVIKK